MRKLLFLPLLLLLGAFASANVRPSETAQSTLIKKFDHEMMAKMLEDMDIESEWDEENSELTFSLDDFDCSIYGYPDEDSGDETTIMFQARHDADGVDLEAVNGWNWENHWGRMYLNSDDDTIVVEMDLDLAGGITKTTLQRNIDHFDETVGSAATLWEE